MDTQNAEKERWISLVCIASSVLSLLVFPIGLLFPRSIYMTLVEWVFIPFWIVLFAIVVRPEYEVSRLTSTMAAMTPAIGIATYTSMSLLVVNLVFRGVKLTPDQHIRCNRLTITAAMFVSLVGIYGIVEKFAER